MKIGMKQSTALMNNHPDYLDILKWAYHEYQDEIVYACSFGAEGIVLIDLINKVNKKAENYFPRYRAPFSRDI